MAAISSNVNTYATVVYASPPLNLRLSPGRAKHERKMLSPVALQAQIFRSCLCADETDAPILGPSRDDVASGPILHALNARVKARRVPSARPLVVVPQHEIHDVCVLGE